MGPESSAATVDRCIETAKFFRAVNEHIEGLNEELRLPEAEFFCECGDSACTLRLRLTLAEFETIRANPRRFLTLPGHEGGIPQLRVVTTSERFSLVEAEP